MSSPRVISWGILATGEIAKTFAKDLLVDPKTRGVDHVTHRIVAAASSTSVSKAESFLDQVGATGARAYGSYSELTADPTIDIVYVATPHSHHYQNVRQCLEAGMNVLCEKPIAINAAQLKILVGIAKKKNCFLMEALWTRYLPVSTYVYEAILSGRIGNILRVISDCSLNIGPIDPQQRLINPKLAGGALLDVGVYSLTWPFLALYLPQSEFTREKPEVLSIMQKHAPANEVDESTVALLRFPRDSAVGGDGHAICTTSIRLDGTPPDQPAVRIQGVKGEIQIFPLSQRPTRSKILFSDGTLEERGWPQPGPGKGSGWYNGFKTWMNSEGEGQGMFWEADEAARALIEGRVEGKYSTWSETVQIMETLDKIRELGGLQYPSTVESVDYPVAN